jgi:hypothetical protein
MAIYLEGKTSVDPNELSPQGGNSNECNGDLDEAAGAADAIACSRDGYFLSYKICVLSDNRLYLHFSTIWLPALLRRSNGETTIQYPLIKDMTGPHPPQTPAVSSKSPYRKCPGGKHLGPRGRSAPAHLSIGY